MNNIKTISNTEILLSRIKGVFPFMIPLGCLQILFAILYHIGIMNKYIAMVPYGIIVLYYLSYFGFIGMAKFLLWLINRHKK